MSTYTYDWTTPILPNLKRIKTMTKRVDDILEIGSFEGRTTCWFLENLLSASGTITCVDPFLLLDDDYLSLGSVDNTLEERKQRFISNTSQSKTRDQNIQLIEKRSYLSLADLIQEKYLFDFIYIDGNHSSESIITDSVMAFGLLKKSGIMLLDDYLLDNSENWFYQNKSKESMTSAKQAIDSFLELFRNSVVQIPLPNKYQIAVIKK